MSYLDVEALWLARIRQLTSQFDASNTARMDWGQRNNGASDHYAVLYPGPHLHRWMSNTGTWAHTYRTIIEVWQRYQADGTSGTDLQTITDATRTHLVQYRKLGDTTGKVQDADIVETRETIRFPADAPQWLITPLVGECIYEQTITFAE